MRYGVRSNLKGPADPGILLSEHRFKRNAELPERIPCQLNRVASWHVEFAKEKQDLFRILKNRIRVAALDCSDVALAESENPPVGKPYLRLDSAVRRNATVDHLCCARRLVLN